MFNMDSSQKDVRLLTITSIFLTVPFIFYARNIANSLSIIAEKVKRE